MPYRFASRRGDVYPFGVNKFPLIPGHEVTGIVDRIGAQVDPSETR